MDDNNLNNQDQNYQPPIPQPGQQFQPKISEPIIHRKKSKKKLLIVILLVLLLAGGAAAAYFLLLKKDATAPATQNATHDQPKTTGPVALSYIQAQPNSPDTIITIDLSDESKKSSFEIKDYEAIMESDVVGNTIAFTAAPKAGNTQTAVFYSDDSGFSFNKVFETKQSNNQDSLGEQITSIKLSSDGTTIAIGLLSYSTRKNTVIEIDPSSKNTKDLFTSEEEGVFVNAYQKDVQLIYTTGCYNCGGENPTTIYSYNIKGKKETSLVTTQATFDRKNIQVNSDFSSLVFAEATLVESEVGNVPSSPYTIKQFDLSGSSSKTLATVDTNDEQVPNFAVNFLAQSSTPYYIAGKKVTSLGGNEPITLFESTQDDVYEVYYANQDVTYFSLGQGNPTTTWVYKNSDKSLTQLLKEVEVLGILGITSNN
jgi:hypothetical protein